MNTRFIMLPEMIEAPVTAVVVHEGKKLPMVIEAISTALVCS